jgi:hypothetical protein
MWCLSGSPFWYFDGLLSFKIIPYVALPLFNNLFIVLLLTCLNEPLFLPFIELGFFNL